MAFNPFHAFRKNSKPLMAVLVLVCMFVFVLSAGIGGGNDFFDWVARQMGADDRRGPVMGEIDGDEYHQHTLGEVRQRRMAANVYMMAAADTAENNMLKQLEQEIGNNVL